MTEAEAAVAIVHYVGAEESVLLMRRAEREGDSWSGHWSFPGGRRDVGDHDLLHTALRELEEECGVRLTRFDMESQFPPRFARRTKGAYVLVTPFLFRTDAELAAIPDAREAAATEWVPLRILKDPDRHRLRSIPGYPAEVLFPAVDLTGAPLWGFTYRLICDWLRVGEASGANSNGFATANLVLDYLQSMGLRLEAGWHGAVAEISGSIPAKSLIEHFSALGFFVHSVNRLHVDGASVRIVGLDMEEYVIRATKP